MINCTAPRDRAAKLMQAFAALGAQLALDNYRVGYAGEYDLAAVLHVADIIRRQAARLEPTLTLGTEPYCLGRHLAAQTSGTSQLAFLRQLADDLEHVGERSPDRLTELSGLFATARAGIDQELASPGHWAKHFAAAA